jgi:hypothetical protein
LSFFSHSSLSLLFSDYFYRALSQPLLLNVSFALAAATTVTVTVSAPRDCCCHSSKDCLAIGAGSADGLAAAAAAVTAAATSAITFSPFFILPVHDEDQK